jgi:hypothetical protein
VIPRVRAGALALAACLALPAVAAAGTSARMSAAFNPERLGAPTTVSFAFRVADEGLAPAPLTGITLTYPRGLGLATSDLGIMACPPLALETSGPAACPPDSRMGAGSATVEIAFGPDLVPEQVTLTLFAGPSTDGYLHLLIYARGESPVQAGVVLSAVLARGQIAITVPPIPSLPEAPYVSVTEMHITLGGNLTYYETVRRRSIPYHPAGIGLPDTCPRGGFRFASRLAFLDGESASTRTVVPCPSSHGG